jgi:hypothetical protein
MKDMRYYIAVLKIYGLFLMILNTATFIAWVTNPHDHKVLLFVTLGLDLLTVAVAIIDAIVENARD